MTRWDTGERFGRLLGFYRKVNWVDWRLVFSALIGSACSPVHDPAVVPCSATVTPSPIRRPILLGEDRPAYLQLSDRQVSAIVRLGGRVGDRNFVCSGTMVSTVWILSSSHCIPLGGESAFVAEIREPVSRTMLSIPVTRVVRHASLDAVLLQLGTPVLGPDPLMVSAEDSSWYVGQRAQIAGFGVTEAGTVGELRFAVSIIDSLDEKAVKTVSVSGSGACQGDSGGPLLVRNRRGMVAQLGVLSKGSMTCNQSDEFLRTDRIAAWLDEIVGEAPGIGDYSCGGVTNVGRCFSGRAIWCSVTNDIVSDSCEPGRACGWSKNDGGYRCVRSEEDPCSGTSDLGSCDANGNLLLCSAGVLQRTACGTCASQCREASDGLFRCGS